jgi:peptide-methionine (S)-S-oxide reductase
MIELATLAGGCFWCTEAVFQRLIGVQKVIPGFSGGKRPNPTYDQVSTGVSGHAESIQIEFDPAKISFEKLLEVFWATHDPTLLNRQGNDVGTEYRSAIFYHSPKQKTVAEQSKAKLQATLTSDQVVTEIVPFTHFYPAETYHQDYFNKNQGTPYCDFIISPKIRTLLRRYGNEVKPEYK